MFRKAIGVCACFMLLSAVLRAIDTPGVPLELRKLDAQLIPDGDNPFFKASLESYLKSQSFKDGGTQIRNQAVLFLLGKCKDAAFKRQHELMTSILLAKFPTSDCYGHEASELVKERFLQGAPNARYLHLLDITGLLHDPEILLKLNNCASRCDDYDMRDTTPFLALTLLGKSGDKAAIGRLIEIVSKTANDPIGIMKAKLMFPYLALVSRPEIVELMRQFVNDGMTIDQGADISIRQVGLSLYASEVLHMILEGYPPIGSGKYYAGEMARCQAWLRDNPNPNLKEADFNAPDHIATEIRWLIGR